jgi:signal transduction histidine kinase
MNPAGLAMIEADSLEQVKGKSILDIIDEPFRNSFIELNKRVFAGISGKLDFAITGLKGTRRWMETHAVPITGTDGVVISSLGITRDVSERKKAEEEIILMNQQLRNLSAHLQNIREEERAYIAREIHDELGQQLTLIKMNLHSLIRKDRSKNPEFIDAATAIGESVSQTIDAVRRIASEMRPFALNDFCIEEAMQLHTTEFSRKTRIPASLNIEGCIDLTEITKCTQLFRIYQEALTNIARHAEATRVVSILKFKNGILQMRINDNGKGFKLPRISEIKSLGLIM